jgi:hypothetical protein
MNSAQECFGLLAKGDGEGLRRLLASDPAVAEARDTAGVSLLMHCLYRGRRDLAEAIAAKKKELDLFEAASLGRLDRIEEYARDVQAVNSFSNDGFTALHFACFFSQPESARLLIEIGATVDAVAANPMRVTPPAAPARRAGQPPPARGLGADPCRRAKRPPCHGRAAAPPRCRSQACERPWQDARGSRPRAGACGSRSPAATVEV